MMLTRILFLGVWCIALIGADPAQKEQSKDAKTRAALAATTTAEQSTIYKIRRLHAKDKELGQAKSKRKGQPQQEKQQQQTNRSALAPHSSPSSSSSSASSSLLSSFVAVGKQSRPKKQKTMSKNSHSLNKKLLNKMGFIKVKAPNSHNRKRLAVESRRHASRDDSHMFIIKLPPNLYYYTGPKASELTKNALLSTQTMKDGVPHKQATTMTMKSAMEMAQIAQTTPQAEALNANGKKVSFPFSSNGRPGRIYHWNLPVLKKALEDKQRFTHVPDATKQQFLDIKDIPTWNKPWENETVEKSFSSTAGNKSNYKKSLKPKSPSYYAPMNAVNKNSFNKYFAGNGKPKGFYVIKENQNKPLYYKNIIS